MTGSEKKTKKKDHLVLTPPNRLKEKMGTGGISKTVLEKAEEIAEKHAIQFFKKANNSLIELQDCCDQIPKEGQSKIDIEIWSKIYKIAHELRGEGATFGHPIISDISKTLIVYLDGFKERPMNSVILKAHINALVVILKHGIKTGDNTTAKELCTTLDDIVQKSLNI
jgi:chemotaxis protein histidine kinase CheA